MVKIHSDKADVPEVTDGIESVELEKSDEEKVDEADTIDLVSVSDLFKSTEADDSETTEKSTESANWRYVSDPDEAPEGVSVEPTSGSGYRYDPDDSQDDDEGEGGDGEEDNSGDDNRFEPEEGGRSFDGPEDFADLETGEELTFEAGGTDQETVVNDVKERDDGSVAAHLSAVDDEFDNYIIEADEDGIEVHDLHPNPSQVDSYDQREMTWEVDYDDFGDADDETVELPDEDEIRDVDLEMLETTAELTGLGDETVDDLMDVAFFEWDDGVTPQNVAGFLDDNGVDNETINTLVDGLFLSDNFADFLTIVSSSLSKDVSPMDLPDDYFFQFKGRWYVSDIDKAPDSADVDYEDGGGLFFREKESMSKAAGENQLSKEVEFDWNDTELLFRWDDTRQKLLFRDTNPPTTGGVRSLVDIDAEVVGDKLEQDSEWNRVSESEHSSQADVVWENPDTGERRYSTRDGLTPPDLKDRGDGQGFDDNEMLAALWQDGLIENDSFPADSGGDIYDMLEDLEEASSDPDVLEEAMPGDAHAKTAAMELETADLGGWSYEYTDPTTGEQRTETFDTHDHLNDEQDVLKRIFQAEDQDFADVFGVELDELDELEDEELFHRLQATEIYNVLGEDPSGISEDEAIERFDQQLEFAFSAAVEEGHVDEDDWPYEDEPEADAADDEPTDDIPTPEVPEDSVFDETSPQSVLNAIDEYQEHIELGDEEPVRRELKEDLQDLAAEMEGEPFEDSVRQLADGISTCLEEEDDISMCVDIAEDDLSEIWGHLITEPGFAQEVLNDDGNVKDDYLDADGNVDTDEYPYLKPFTEENDSDSSSGDEENNGGDNPTSDMSVPSEGVERQEDGYYVSADPDSEKDIDRLMESEEIEKAMFTQRDDDGNVVEAGIDTPQGGFTLQRNLESYNIEDDDAWIVGLDSVEFNPSVDDIGKEDVAEWYEEVLPVLEETPAIRIGGYHFKEGMDKVSIDVSLALDDGETAEELGKRLNQESVFNPAMALGEGDWDNGSVMTYEGDRIDIDDPSEAPEDADVEEDENGYYYIDDSDVGDSPLDSPDDIIEFIQNEVDDDVLAKTFNLWNNRSTAMGKDIGDIAYYESEDGDRMSMDQVNRAAAHEPKDFESDGDGFIFDGVRYEPIYEESEAAE